MRHFIIGDIHARSGNLEKLIALVGKEYISGDMIVFCGDYIDRGPNAYEVMEILSAVSTKYRTVFLMGNHEAMLESYLKGEVCGLSSYLVNGGASTLRSYQRQYGEFFIPDSHASILFSHRYIYEYDDFVVVHAGFDPDVSNFKDNDPYTMVWIREKFFKSGRKWNKTVIFGHTPTQFMGKQLGKVFSDSQQNIIGIDTGAVYGGKLTCLIWPERNILQS